MSVKAYCNVHFSHPSIKPVEASLVPCKATPLPTSYHQALPSLITEIGSKLKHTHFTIRSSNLAGDVHNGRDVYTVFIRATNLSTPASIQKLCGLITHYTPKK